jgi:predicted acyltransferase
MMFVPGPDFPAGCLEPRQNLALWVDDLVLGRFRDGTTYAWILAGPGFGASVLLGSFAGQILRVPSWTPPRRLLALCGLGIGCLAGGYLWSFHFPMIKHLWTSSMVLWAAGWSYLLLALFYLMVDMGGLRKPVYPFVVLGANAIVAYMLPHILDFEDFARWLFGIPEPSPSVIVDFVVSVFAFVMVWIPLYVLYRKKIFVKV